MSRVGQLLLVIGGAVGVAAVIGLVVGLEPASLPPALINVAVYKLTFVAAAGLLAAGAILHRYARRGERADERDEALPESARGVLGEGAPNLDPAHRDSDRPAVGVPHDTGHTP